MFHHFALIGITKLVVMSDADVPRGMTALTIYYWTFLNGGMRGQFDIYWRTYFGAFITFAEFWVYVWYFMRHFQRSMLIWQRNRFQLVFDINFFGKLYMLLHIIENWTSLTPVITSFPMNFVVCVEMITLSIILEAFFFFWIFYYSFS